MSHLPPLRNELSMHRKRKQISIDGTVAGIDFNRARGDYAELPVNFGRPGSAPADYLGPMPQDYRPHPGFTDSSRPEYEQYEWGMQQHPTPPLRAPLPELPEVERPPNYNACLMTNELFEQAMQECVAYPDIPEPIPVDHDVRAQGIMNSQDTLEDLVADPFPQDPVHEIEQAFDQQMQQMEQVFAAPMQEPEPQQPPPEPPPEQMYEDPWMMNPFGMPGMGPMM